MILEKYSSLLGKREIEVLLEKAKDYSGKKILNINATKFGGGVAEILQNMIP